MTLVTLDTFKDRSEKERANQTYQTVQRGRKWGGVLAGRLEEGGGPARSASAEACWLSCWCTAVTLRQPPSGSFSTPALWNRGSAGEGPGAGFRVPWRFGVFYGWLQATSYKLLHAAERSILHGGHRCSSPPPT